MACKLKIVSCTQALTSYCWKNLIWLELLKICDITCSGCLSDSLFLFVSFSERCGTLAMTTRELKSVRQWPYLTFSTQQEIGSEGVAFLQTNGLVGPSVPRLVIFIAFGFALSFWPSCWIWIKTRGVSTDRLFGCCAALFEELICSAIVYLTRRIVWTHGIN